MVSVTGRTAESIDELMDELVSSMRIDDNGQLIYSKRSGEEITVGSLANPTAAIDAVYPINSLFFSTIPTNPHTQLGLGTWIRFGKGKTLVSLDEANTLFDDPEGVGGSATLTAAMLPPHQHKIDHTHSTYQTNYAGDHAHGLSVSWRTDVPASSTNSAVTHVGGAGNGNVGGSATGATAVAGSHQHDFSVPAYAGDSGDGAANGLAGGVGNNMPPYIVLYIWKRTA